MSRRMDETKVLAGLAALVQPRITSYNVCYTKLLRAARDVAGQHAVGMRGDEMAEGGKPGRLRQGGEAREHFCFVHASRHIDIL